ncbi:MAG: Fur family transcriptional regulator [Pseudomonadota bacterium]
MGRRGEMMQSDVMKALKGADEPLSAYDIIAALRNSYPKLAPTTVYRALKALMENGRIHRVESLNAYMPCQHAHSDEQTQQHPSILSICDDCGSVEESAAPDLFSKLGRIMGKSGFTPERHVIEVHGRCADCGPERAAT